MLNMYYILGEYEGADNETNTDLWNLHVEEYRSKATAKQRK